MLPLNFTSSFHKDIYYCWSRFILKRFVPPCTQIIVYLRKYQKVYNVVVLPFQSKLCKLHDSYIRLTFSLRARRDILFNSITLHLDINNIEHNKLFCKKVYYKSYKSQKHGCINIIIPHKVTSFNPLVDIHSVLEGRKFQR